jgi:hypothetical protein
MLSENEAIRLLQKRYSITYQEAKETFASDLECKLFITGRKGFKNLEAYKKYLNDIEEG